MVELEDNLNAIMSSDGIDQLRETVNRMIRSLGYTAYTYMDVRRLPLSGEPAPFFVSTLKENFLDAYQSEDFFGYDPVIRRAATTNAPFTWADCPEYHTWKRARRGARNRARYVMQVASEYGFTQGYVLPAHAVDIHGHPSSALLSLYWSNKPDTLVPKAAMPAWLKLTAASMHERMLELRGLSSDGIDIPLLTDRERECMVWACRGKTRNETADILGISDRTVEFHFQNAMRKLRVHNKFHAIAMAIHMGLVVP